MLEEPTGYRRTRILRDRDSLIRPVAVQKWEGIEAFQLRTPRRNANSLELQHIL
jgi:hypothetical protein